MEQRKPRQRKMKNDNNCNERENTMGEDERMREYDKEQHDAWKTNE
jgi:hypothetical protein